MDKEKLQIYETKMNKSLDALQNEICVHPGPDGQSPCTG